MRTRPTGISVQLATNTSWLIPELYTVKPVYNDHLMGYFSKGHLDELQKADIVTKVNWYLQSSLKHITEWITGNAIYFRGDRYRQVSLH